MTTITGIDIRKAILSNGLRPSDYDESALFKAVSDLGLSDDPETLSEFIGSSATDFFKVGYFRP